MYRRIVAELDALVHAVEKKSKRNSELTKIGQLACFP
jgi:hypothetical protein